ncbi:MAG TPA: hemolysin III family protein [Acidimicrobiia bacterium]|nr:hemolysin III family protein [Acidimicrobiia bacterium]
MERVRWGRMENPLRGVLHGSAAVVSLIGLVTLLTLSPPERLPATALFGIALVAMFTISALYHSVPWSHTWKTRMQRLDHSVIFVVVASTFTPLAIAALEGPVLWIGLALVWGIAIVGIVLKFSLDQPRTGLSLGLQMAMGWSALLWLPWFWSQLGWGAVALIGLGGACYTVGAVFFALKRPRLLPHIFGYHELFHVLVIAGAAFHFWAVAAFAT